MERLRRLALFGFVALQFLACSRAVPTAAVGDVEAVDPSREHVTIRHPEISGALPSGSTQFAVAAPDLLARIATGMRVRFEFRRVGETLEITQLTPVTEGQPGVHDHTPHHGGVVAMAGMTHLEAVAAPDGRVRLFVSDMWRRPLPLTAFHGNVTLGLPGAHKTMALVAADDAFEVSGPQPAQSTVHARFELMKDDGQSIEMNFVLPVAPQAAGAAGVPASGCEAPVARGGEAPPARLRCVLHFAQPITAIAATPDGTLALVAAVDLGVSAWRLPAGQLVRGFAPPPPISGPVDEAPHAESVNAMAVRSDGSEAVIAIEGRLVRYAIATGQVVREIKGPGGVLRAAAWSPDGRALLATAFYDTAAHLLDADDGHELQRFPVEREGAAVAFAADGQRVAVGSETGPITIYDTASGVLVRRLIGATAAAQALMFFADRLAAVGDDGALRVWNLIDGALAYQHSRGGQLTRIAGAANGRMIASAGNDGSITFHDVATGAVADTWRWHSGPVLGLAWVGDVVISGDAAGDVALWEFGSH